MERKGMWHMNRQTILTRRGAILSSSFAINLGQECVVANDYGIPMEAPSMGVGMVGVDC
jgi:hypothetical protein